MLADIQNIYHGPICQPVIQFVLNHKMAIISAIGAATVAILAVNTKTWTETCISKYGNFEYGGWGPFQNRFKATIDDQMFKDGFDFINHPPFSQCTTTYF